MEKIEELVKSVKEIQLDVKNMKLELKNMNVELHRKLDVLIESSNVITTHVTFIETLYYQIKKPFHFIMSLPFTFPHLISGENKLIGNSNRNETDK
jgi:hypothetical protein